MLRFQYVLKYNNLLFEELMLFLFGLLGNPLRFEVGFFCDGITVVCIALEEVISAGLLRYQVQH